MKQITEHEINVMAEHFCDVHLDALSNKWLAMRFAFREGFKAAGKLNGEIRVSEESDCIHCNHYRNLPAYRCCPYCSRILKPESDTERT